MTHSVSPDLAPAAPAPTLPAALVEELLRTLTKALRAHQLYLRNNPVHARALDTVRAGFAAVWEHQDELSLAVSETEFRWDGHVVMQEPTKSPDSLPWLFFKDGIRELRFQRGFEEEEMVGLLDIIQKARHGSSETDDLLTLLWEKDFSCLRYRFVDLALEATVAVPEALSEEDAASAAAEISPTSQALEESPPAGMVSMEDFDSTLYFLDESEIEYLRKEIEQEYASELRTNVLSMLLDIYEQQTEATVREEIAGIIEGFMLHLLSAGQFRAVAFLIREANATIARSQTLTAAQRQRLGSLPDRLSAPESLAQLLQALDEASELPPQDELNELFEQLRGSAIGTVFAWLGRLHNVKLRVVLESAAARLAAANTGELVRLIAAGDQTVMLEAIRRAGALRTAAAVSPLAKVLSEADAVTRLAAVEALSEIGSAGALQVLERAVDDPDRDVRVATARALTARAYRAALPRIEAVITAKAIRDADLTEKMALFEAYGALCGPGGVPALDRILNGKGFLGRREDPELRACAAVALGRIGTQEASAVLRQAQEDKEVLVRNAVSRALRGGNA